ncbi:polysaccharide biosynthesis C-terminal domain-containing protein [Jeotgalibacillus sp. ET6]|uniref:oligosaccharide flippase family protein n=1 Tax=Jeotgalibacillus sp. ET6 TaxID=3037260 RepID=UPI002418288A|nr:polysaccharide biosynthesis C-terminal domain-containing protein [Jeotgalibacillus sp. ET6]MDG5471708.1 polysaccharide biosynthesis C-terminal domain-containing protein [Jeotgalibacillus sp. ET6]
MPLKENPSNLFIVSAVSAAVSFITGIWIRNILGPEEYGIWLIYSLFLVYGYYLQFGILEGFSRDVPRMLGQGRFKKADEIRSTALVWILMSSGMSFLGVIVLLILPLTFFETIMGVMALLLVPFQNLVLFFNHFYLTVQQFNKVAVIQLIIGSLQYVVMGICAIFIGIYGLFLGVLIGSVAALTYSRLKMKTKIPLKWHSGLFKKLLNYGFRITLIGILLSLFTTMDRLLIFAFFDSVSVGMYGIIAFIYQGIMVLPSVFHQVMYPKINYQYGATGKKKALMPIILEPTILLSYISPILLGIAFFVFPWFVQIFMPEYVAGTTAARIVIVGMFFFIWAMLYAHYLTVVHKEWSYLKVLCCGVLINAIINLIMIRLGYYINGVALGTAVSYMLYPLLLMFVCFRDMGLKWSEYVRHFGTILLPFGIMVSLMAVIEAIPIHFIVQISLYLLCYLLFLFVSSNKMPLLSAYKDKGFQIIGKKLGMVKKYEAK